MKIESRTSASVIRSATFIDEKDIGIIDCVRSGVLRIQSQHGNLRWFRSILAKFPCWRVCESIASFKNGEKIKRKKRIRKKKAKKINIKSEEWNKETLKASKLCLAAVSRWALLICITKLSTVIQSGWKAVSGRNQKKLPEIVSHTVSATQSFWNKKWEETWHDISRKLYSYKYVCQMITREYSFSIWIWSYASISIKLPSAKKYLLLRWETYLGFC